jgi:hypothetical protein
VGLKLDGMSGVEAGARPALTEGRRFWEQSGQ